MDMYFKQLFAPVVGLNVADVVSVAKTRFAQWYSESSYFTSCVGRSSWCTASSPRPH